MERVLRARAVLVAVAIVIVVATIAIGAPPSEAAPIPEPHADPFYQPPAGFESKAPGTILRSRSVTVRALGIPVPVRSWQMLVRSTDSKGRPVGVVSTLMVPLTPYFGKRPLVSYQPAIDSLGDQCNPSYTLQVGLEKESALIAAPLLRGWAVVVTDYEGPRNAFAASRMAGNAVLDGIRGAQRLPNTGLAGTTTPVGLTGYSGGGQATIAAAELHPTYAPELALKGVAAGGVPADIDQIGPYLDGGFGSGLLITAALGVSREYPEIASVLNADGQRLAAEAADTCLIEAAVRYSFQRLGDYTTMPEPLADPVVAAVLDDIELGRRKPTAPIYLYHAVFDELIPVQVGRDLRSSYCQQGSRVQYEEDYIGEHISVNITRMPAVMSYLDARFKGRPVPSNC